MQTENKNTTAMIIASQNQDYVDEGLAEYQDQIHKLQSKSCIGYKYRKVASSNMSRFEAHTGFFRLLMKRIFDSYVVWPFDKKLIS